MYDKTNIKMKYISPSPHIKLELTQNSNQIIRFISSGMNKVN